jgi:hypothetical protein
MEPFMSASNQPISPFHRSPTWATSVFFLVLLLLQLLVRTPIWKTLFGDLIGLLLVISGSYASYIIGSTYERTDAISTRIKTWLHIRGMAFATCWIPVAIYGRFLTSIMSWNTRPIFGSALLLVLIGGYASEIIRSRGDTQTISIRRRWALVVVTALALALWALLVFA